MQVPGRSEVDEEREMEEHVITGQVDGSRADHSVHTVSVVHVTRISPSHRCYGHCFQSARRPRPFWMNMHVPTSLASRISIVMNVTPLVPGNTLRALKTAQNLLDQSLGSS